MRDVFPWEDDRVDVFAHEWFVFDYRQGGGSSHEESRGGDVSHCGRIFPLESPCIEWWGVVWISDIEWLLRLLG